MPDARPPYQRIAAQIRGMIFANELEPGDRVPSRRALALEHDCALETVARAMELLQHEGFVTSIPGIGTFVHEQPLIHRYGSRRLLRGERPQGSLPFQHEAEREGQAANQIVSGVDVLRPTADIAAQLGVDEVEDVLCRHHVLWANEIAVALVDTYYRLAFAAGTPLESPAVLEMGSHTYIADVKGIQLAGAVEAIHAREATAAEVDQLHLRQGEPVIRLLRTLYDGAGVPLQVSDHRLAADKYVLYYDIPAS